MKLLSVLVTATLVSALDSVLQRPITTARHHRIDAPPLLGFGTWNLKSEGHNASKAVAHAITTGYRHIDCAAIYGNEKDVGRGINRGLEAAGLGRDEIWVTSKLWNDHHEPEQVPKALARTLKDLDVGYLDLYLMHWPVGDKKGRKSIDFVKTWKAMEALLAMGLVRHIGVSNFDPEQLRELMAHATVRPFAHQMELHPYLPQSAWVQYHHEQGIHVTAYSPLGNANPTYSKQGKSKGPPIPLMGHPVMERVARKQDCTPATVALAWGMSRGVSVIPKSQHRDRIEENFAGCDLEYEDIVNVQMIGRLNLTRFNNPSEGWNVPLYQGLEDS